MALPNDPNETYEAKATRSLAVVSMFVTNYLLQRGTGCEGTKTFLRGEAGRMNEFPTIVNKNTHPGTGRNFCGLSG